MKLGDKGEKVKELQQLLGSRGYKLIIDGDFGPRTEAAVKDFQKNRSLPVTGVADAATVSALGPVPVVVSQAIDDRTKSKLLTLDPKAQKIFTPFIVEAKRIAAEMGYDYVAISGNRTWEEQDALYAQGRTKPGPIVTNARGGQSNHNFRIALDFGVFKNGIYMDEKAPYQAEKVHLAVSKIAGKYGIDWGGGWKTIKDYPHFEISTGLSMSEKREKFQKYGSVL